MIIAVTYDKNDGSIWQHFGRTENFKIYKITDGKIESTKVVETNGQGHGALPVLLEELGANLVICGGLGSSMVSAIVSRGMELIPGVEGDADKAVEGYLSGQLVANTDAVHEGCHHHDEGVSCGDTEEKSCGCHDEDEGCGCHGEEGGCGCHGNGGCCNCTIEGENVGKNMKVHYTGTFNDGTVFDSSYDRGEPLEFICGAGMMIKGFDIAVADMKVGEIKEVHLMPEEAYGMPDENAIFTVKIAQLPGSEGLGVGERVFLTNQFGQPIPVNVLAKDDETITLDANHEMAGKELNFKIEIVDIEG